MRFFCQIVSLCVCWRNRGLEKRIKNARPDRDLRCDTVVTPTSRHADRTRNADDLDLDHDLDHDYHHDRRAALVLRASARVMWHEDAMAHMVSILQRTLA